MRKQDFLSCSNDFVRYFVALLNGDELLAFKHENGDFRSIHDALKSYRWPNRRIDIPTPDGDIQLSANCDFEKNRIVLEKLKQGICTAFKTPGNNDSLAAWAKAIMVWGGVFTKRGNARWLHQQGSDFGQYLVEATNVLAKDDDDAPRELPSLRSNAGTTKIHSLLLDNFVIYDSRVAAALAWLVFKWAKQNRSAIPEHLRFACMRANTTRNKVRSPCQDTFPYFAPTKSVRGSHHRHALWNMRANWIIEAAFIARASSNNNWKNSREIEAALFMVGDDLRRTLLH